MHNIVLKRINKNRKKEHKLYLFFHLEEDEKKAKIYANN